MEVNNRLPPILCILEPSPPQTSSRCRYHGSLTLNQPIKRQALRDYLIFQPWPTRTRDCPSAANADTLSSKRRRRSHSERHAAIAHRVENSQPPSLVPRSTSQLAKCFRYRPISSRGSPSSPIQPRAATPCTATSVPSAECAFSMLACSRMVTCDLSLLSRAELSNLGWIGRK